MECKRSSDGRSLDHRVLEVLRQQAIRAVREGQSVQSIASAFGVNIRSVFRWLADYAHGGETALLAKPIPGRPAKITADEMTWLAQVVKDNTPQRFDYDAGLWNASLIAALLERQFGKTLSPSAASRIQKGLGVSVRKPTHRVWQRDPELARRWEDEIYPGLRATAHAAKASLYFSDKSVIRNYATPKAGIATESSMDDAGQVHLVSAISARGELRFMLHEGVVTAAVFVEFLRRLLIGADKPIYLVVDEHPVNRSRAVKEFIEESEGRLKLLCPAASIKEEAPAKANRSMVRVQPSSQTLRQANRAMG